MTAVPGYGEVFGGTIPAPIWHEFMLAAHGVCGATRSRRRRRPSSPSRSPGSSRPVTESARRRHCADRACDPPDRARRSTVRART